MGPQSSTRISYASDLSFCEYQFRVPGNEIPNWFNHQRVGSSISFWIGPEFPAIALCLAFGKEDGSWDFNYQVDISVNGSKRIFERNIFGGMSSDHLCFSCRPQRSLQKLFQDLNLGDRNHVELFTETFVRSFPPGQIAPTIKRIGVHVECICPSPQNSGIFYDNYEGVHVECIDMPESHIILDKVLEV